MTAMTGLESDVSRHLSVMFTQCPADSLLALLGAGRAIYFAWMWMWHVDVGGSGVESQWWIDGDGGGKHLAVHINLKRAEGCEHGDGDGDGENECQCRRRSGS